MGKREKTKEEIVKRKADYVEQMKDNEGKWDVSSRNNIKDILLTHLTLLMEFGKEVQKKYENNQ
mgnify:CR=1 FL=1